jgi:drug/metabolite transporter (DMT)-like permease
MNTVSGGVLLFGGRSNWRKILAVIGILAGAALTVMGW